LERALQEINRQKKRLHQIGETLRVLEEEERVKVGPSGKAEMTLMNMG